MSRRPGNIDIDVKIVDTAAVGNGNDGPEETRVSTLRLVATLTLGGALAGLLIVFVDLHTRPIIDAYRAEQLQLAIYEVLPGATSYRTLYLVDGNLVFELPLDAEATQFPQAYIGYREGGGMIGVAASRGESGFQDVVRVIYGFEPDTGILLGMKVLESKETPGLGDKIYKDQTFVDQFFDRPRTPLLAVAADSGQGMPGEIDAIAGATISSDTVVRIINNGLAHWREVLARGIPEGPP